MRRDIRKAVVSLFADAPLAPVAGSLLGLCLSACSPPVHYYADAGHNDAYYAEIRAHHPQPTTLRVDLRVLRDGELDEAATLVARDDLIHVLDRLGGFKPTDDPQAANVLTVIIDGSYDPSARGGNQLLLSDAANGVGTNTVIADHYSFRISYREGDHPLRVGSYQHAVLSTIGSKPVAAGNRGPYLELNEAFDIVVEDVLLHFLKDVQDTASMPVPMVYLK